jgi:hypothetical protein
MKKKQSTFYFYCRYWTKISLNIGFFPRLGRGGNRMLSASRGELGTSIGLQPPPAPGPPTLVLKQKVRRLSQLCDKLDCSCPPPPEEKAQRDRLARFDLPRIFMADQDLVRKF